MKRSPLRRITPLKRATAPLSRSKPLGRGKPRRAIFPPADGDPEPLVREHRRLKSAWKYAGRARVRCPCGAPVREAHHVVYRQEIERLVGKSAGRVIYDLRNRLFVCHECHERHHNRSRPLSLNVLPDSAFDFAVELLGRERAYEYLRRRYSGRDVRLYTLIA